MTERRIRALVVFGTRPEAIKLAPVIRELKRRPEFQTLICVTAQHRGMLDQVLRLFDIRPDYDLNLMRQNQTLFQVTAEVLRGLERVLREERPDVVIVQGDTTTSFTATLAAFYLKIPVGHVEAGLRTGDRYNPFPEEANRRLTDALSVWCFAPTERARQNLVNEGVPEQSVFVTGNTIIDALRMIVRRQAKNNSQREFQEYFRCRYGIEFNRNVKPILVTAHRRESFGPDLESICLGLKMIADRNDFVRIIYPVHLNPNVRCPVRKILSRVKRVHLIEPLDYGYFVWILDRCYFVLTDSGGVQEEAPALGKPVLILRKTTERPEGAEAGIARIVGTESQSIFTEAQKLLDDERAYKQMAQTVNPYGDGHAAERIAKVLMDMWPPALLSGDRSLQCIHRARSH